MSVENIPREAGWFIDRHITSVAQLESLLLLQTDPARTWSPAEIARELRLDATWVQAQLDVLSDLGLLQKADAPEPAYQYAPRDQHLRNVVTVVAQAYITNRVSVIERIYSHPSDQLRAFSDAFRLRKDTPNG